MASRAGGDGASAAAPAGLGAAVASAHNNVQQQIARARAGFTRVVAQRQMAVPPLRSGSGLRKTAAEAGDSVAGPCLANISMATSSASQANNDSGNNIGSNGSGDGDPVRRRRGQRMARDGIAGGVTFVSDGGSGEEEGEDAEAGLYKSKSVDP
jgi:hypothetical protein